MRSIHPRLTTAFFAAAIAMAAPAVTHADEPSAQQATHAAARGLAVIALPGASAAASSLARDVYNTQSLYNASVDEPHAHVLAGEAPANDAPKELRDLADTCAAIKGDDAPSRQLLAAIAQRFGLRAIIVVTSPTTARVFLVDTNDFDAATYTPDASASPTPASGAPTWSATVQSLARAYGAPNVSTPPPATTAPPPPVTTTSASPPAPPANANAKVAAPAAALHEVPRDSQPAPGDAPTPFYKTGWFWGVLGAAAFAGGAMYFATRDNTPSTIHLQMQVPH
jgi:hypothetical protein